MRPPALWLTVVLVPALGACACPRRCPPAPRLARAAAPAPASPAPAAVRPAERPPARAEAWYLGDGTPTDLEGALAAVSDADLIAFGELHGHPAGAAAQLALLRRLAADGRPVALAMEFFERDTQAVLDAYLRGEVPSEQLRKEARLGPDYPHTHGPLIDFCRERGIPVIAANAPRRLVTAYRKSGADFEAFRGAQPDGDRAWLPRETSVLEDAYRERFLALMGPERGPAFFRSQSLWDDAMAEAVADFRAARPAHRVLLIVGGFHVAHGEGTLTKYRLRRGKDEVRILLMSPAPAPASDLAFLPADLGSADVVLKVRMRHAPRPNPQGPQPTPPAAPPAKATPPSP